jgi:tetratricopeptide (TPR) repeat protein
MRHARIAIASSLLLLLALAAPVYGQRDAIAAGRVVDQTGTPIRGAQVEIVSIDRGDHKNARTDEDGEYMIRGLRVEMYVLRVTAEGFATVENEVKMNFGMNTVDATMAAASTEPDVDYEAINKLYEDAYKAYEKASQSSDPGDWSQVQVVSSELIAGLAGLTSDEANSMRQSVYELLGRSELEVGNMEASLTAWQAILVNDPDSLVANVWAAQAYTRNGDYASALPYLARAAELAPDDASVQYNAGAVMLQQNDVEGGIEHMERAIALRPEGFPVALKNLGYAYLRVQRYEDAVARLKDYLELSPEAADRAEVEQMIAALEAQLQG